MIVPCFQIGYFVYRVQVMELMRRSEEMKRLRREIVR
jgi:hypothetical protein